MGRMQTPRNFSGRRRTPGAAYPILGPESVPFFTQLLKEDDHGNSIETGL